MDASLILHENITNTNDPFIRLHGKEYINIKEYTPEVSGLYELLFSWNSQYTNLIEKRIFIPVFYYDSISNKWYHSNKEFNISDSNVLAWSLIE